MPLAQTLTWNGVLNAPPSEKMPLKPNGNGRATVPASSGWAQGPSL